MLSFWKILTNAVFLIFSYFEHLFLFLKLYKNNNCNNINIYTCNNIESMMYFKFIFVSTFIVIETQNQDVSQA